MPPRSWGYESFSCHVPIQTSWVQCLIDQYFLHAIGQDIISRYQGAEDAELFQWNLLMRIFSKHCINGILELEVQYEGSLCCHCHQLYLMSQDLLLVRFLPPVSSL